MMLVMLPFFLLGVYEKNGQPLEKVAGNIIRASIHICQLHKAAEIRRQVHIRVIPGEMHRLCPHFVQQLHVVRCCQPNVQHPDYSLYPQFTGTAYGFLTRGCPRSCPFCIVSGKEGRRSRQVADLSEFWDGQREIKLLDANLLACPDHEKLLLQLADSRALVDFSQGLESVNTRLL